VIHFADLSAIEILSGDKLSEISCQFNSLTAAYSSVGNLALA
jgi:hypothetical protein